MPDAVFVHEGDAIPYTPVAAVDAGDIVVLETIVGIARTPIAAGALGSLAVEGVFDVPAAAEIITQGEWLYWDALNNCATTTDTTLPMGFAVDTIAADDLIVRVYLQYGIETAG